MAARSSDDIPCDTRHMKAHWFWTLVNRNEDIGLDLLKNNYSLVFLPMDYGELLKNNTASNFMKNDFISVCFVSNDTDGQ